MSDKLFAKRRILAFFMVLVLFFSVLVFLLPNAKINAETNSGFNVSSSGEVSNEVAMASELESISEGEYDAFTDTDTFVYNNEEKSIWQYSEIYNGLYNKEKKLYEKKSNRFQLTNSKFEDPIGLIVPLDLMKSGKDYLYCGKEYGFFISSVKKSDEIVFSTVFVFDIKYNMNRHIDAKHNGCVSVEVAPVFQYRYVWLQSTNDQVKKFYMKNYDNDIELPIDYNISSDILVPHPNIYWNIGKDSYDFDYSYQDVYYLTDISIAMSLFNEQALNYGDDGYDPNNDRGAFFIMTESEYFGRKLQKGELTDDDKTNIALFAVDCAINLVAFGANIVAPGSGSLLKMITTATNVAGDVSWAVSSSLAWENTYNNLQDSFTIDKNIATFNSLYANRAEQLKTYKNLAKSILVANNPENTDNNIWYGQGDHYKAYFGINADIQSGEQFPNTRALVECALKIVEKNKKANVYYAQNAVSKTVDNKVYQDEAKLGIEKELYLLEDGYNYFVFLPNFSGNYKFNVNLANEVELKVDGKTSADNTFYIEKRGAANPVKVQIDNIGNFARGELFIDALPMSQSFELSAGAENIVRADVESSGYYDISIKNSNNVTSNAIFTNKFTPNDRFGVYEDLSNMNNETTYLGSNTYLVIKNVSNTKETVYVDCEDVEEIAEVESINSELIRNVPKYFKLLTAYNTEYEISYLNDSYVSVSVYDINGQELIKETFIGETYSTTEFNSATLGEVYIKVVYIGSNDKIDFNFNVFNIKSEIRWFIDDKEVPSRVVEIERGKTVKISVKINDTYVSGIKGQNRESEITFSNNLITIAKTAPLGKITYTFELRNNSSFSLTVVPIFEKTINTSLDSAWNLNYSGGNRIEKFEYYVEVSDGENERASSQRSSGTCDIYNQLSSTRNENPKINIKSIVDSLVSNVPSGGWQDSYLYVYVYITKIYIVVDDSGSFDTHGTFYVSKSYCRRDYDFFASGSGTQSNPYKISTTKEFNSLKMLHRDVVEDSYFKQTANLSFGNVLPQTGSTSFRGIYDGGGYTISYSYKFPSANFKSYIGGMFLDNYGTISNLTVNATINNLSVSNKYDLYGLGGIVGTNYGTINKINANVSISSCFYLTGGIASVNNGTIENCKVTGKIDLKCENDVFHGGMIAGSTFGKISSCSSANSTISYIGAESKSRTLEPRIGTTVGVWAGGTLLPTGYGTVNKGTLKTVTWWEGLKKKSHNQAAYVGNIYGQKTF